MARSSAERASEMRVAVTVSEDRCTASEGTGLVQNSTVDGGVGSKKSGTQQHKSRRDSADVGRRREFNRSKRLAVLAVVLMLLFAWQVLFDVGLAPSFTTALVWLMLPFLLIDPFLLIVGVFFLLMIGSLVVTQAVAGRSPHVLYRPDQVPVRLEDVKGVGPIKEDVERSLDLFLAGATFRSTMGGTPRRGILFEGAPGTGKTLMAKAMASEAGVPFLFVSGSSFQSMYYGATARKIRSYFKTLRKTARREGAAIGFIEEIDAIATVRNGMSMTPHGEVSGASPAVLCCGGLSGLPGAPDALETAQSVPGGTRVERVVSEGVGGVVNELLVQLQSFDEPTGWQKMVGKLADGVNLFLPEHHQVPRPRTAPAEVLIIAATNRADNLDPALLRPGRFDRKLTFDLPDKAGRRELVEYFLGKKQHEPELDDPERIDALAGVTQGYSPVMIENLLDEALVNAVRRDAAAMSWADIERARLVIGVGLGQPVGYTEHEQRLIATHEAGHAAVAFLEAPHRRLEVLSIIKRASALGLLAHGDADDVYTRSRNELVGLIRVSLGGLAAEQIFFGDVSTGPASDLVFANEQAAMIVGAAGMTNSLISFAAAKESALASSNLVAKVIADPQARAGMEQLLADQKAYVVDLLERNRHIVEALRDALLERHELIGSEITDVIAAAGTPVGPTRVPPVMPRLGADTEVVRLELVGDGGSTLPRRMASRGAHVADRGPAKAPSMVDLVAVEAALRALPVDD